VARNPESARVGVPVAVDEDNVRRVSQFGESAEQNWNFPKAEQAWHIGERDPALCPNALDLDHLGKAIGDNSGNRHVFTRVDGHVGARHDLQLRKPILPFEPIPEPELDLRGFLRGNLPPMQSERLHAANANCCSAEVSSWPNRSEDKANRSSVRRNAGPKT
jgi:hypothetical protein